MAHKLEVEEHKDEYHLPRLNASILNHHPFINPPIKFGLLQHLLLRFEHKQQHHL